MEWSKNHKGEAAKQGWELRDFWNQEKTRLEYEIFKLDSSSLFTSDESARGFVSAQASRGDALALLTKQLIFHSKLKGKQ